MDEAGSVVAKGQHTLSDTVRWSRTYLVPTFVAVVLAHLRGVRGDYVHADLLMAKKHRVAYEAAHRLGGREAVLALREELVLSVR